MPKPAAPSSVLLLGWDETSAALPLARALSATAAAELWTARPLAAAPAGTRYRALDQAPPLPALPGLGQAAPAFPYVGRAESRPLAVPAAPYLGSSQAPPPRPAGAAPLIARTSLPGRAAGQPLAVPAAPYQGATPAASGFPAPSPRADYRVPVAPLPPMLRPAMPVEAIEAVNAPAAEQPAEAYTAEPGPAEAAAFSGQLPATLALPEMPPELAPAAEANRPALPAAATAAPPATTAAEAVPVTETAAELAAAPAAADAAEPAPDADGLPLPAAPSDAAALNFSIIQYARRAARLAYESSFDVIFAPDWHTWLAGVELRQLTRRPLVLQVEQLATELATPAARGWMEALERLTLPRADRILVPDEVLADRLRQRYRLPAGRVVVVAPGSAPDLGAALVLDSRFSL